MASSRHSDRSRKLTEHKYTTESKTEAGLDYVLSKLTPSVILTQKAAPLKPFPK